MKVSAWGTLLFLAWAPLVGVTDGCSSQHEGERCDKTNADLDCGAGLLCKRVYVQEYHWICCPVPPVLATVSACNASGGPVGDGGQPVIDAGPDADAGDDAGDATSENGAAGEASADRATNDSTADIAVDTGVDMTGDIAVETAADTDNDTIPTADGDDDATNDASSEPAIDAADDLSSDVVIDAEDATDAPTADGAG